MQVSSKYLKFKHSLPLLLFDFSEISALAIFHEQLPLLN